MLEEFHEENRHEMASGEVVNLVTEILDPNFKEGTISGVFSQDFVERRSYRRKMVEEAVTEEAPFWIKRFEDRIFLIVSAPSGAAGVKKLLTGNVANKLSEVLFSGRGSIVEMTISHATLKELHESSPQATRLIWFDNVDMPGVEKLCLAGSDLADTGLYHDYLEHGNIWYVVFEDPRRGIVVGITRRSVVTLFSKRTKDEFIKYISDDILPLVE